MSESYAYDKPKDCRFCYFYDRHKGCCLNICYYRVPEKPKTRCDDCPYNKPSSCIGWCTKDIIRSVRGYAE